MALLKWVFSFISKTHFRYANWLMQIQLYFLSIFLTAAGPLDFCEAGVGKRMLRKQRENQQAGLRVLPALMPPMSENEPWRRCSMWDRTLLRFTVPQCTCLNAQCISPRVPIVKDGWVFCNIALKWKQITSSVSTWRNGDLFQCLH